MRDRAGRGCRRLACAVAGLAICMLAACGREQAAPAPIVDAPAPVRAAAPSVALPPAPVPVPPIEHLPVPSAACLANSTPATAPRATAVHRWTDAAGITHYSDQPPPAAARDHRVIAVQGVPPIEVQASGYDANLPDHLQQRAVADALGVQRALHDALGVPAPSGSSLRVVFVRDAATYAQLIGDPALAGSAGAYSTARRTIYVRRQMQDEASFAVLRHEITHALVHESIGNLPTPINEGLAEYFGRYRISGLGGQVDIGADRTAIVAAAPAGDGAEALVDLLARDGADFYALAGDSSTREQRYLRAYALVAMLMRDAPGRAALAAVLSAQRDDPCRPAAAESVLDARYPGGLRALAAAWVDFMRAPPAAIHAY